MDVGSLFSGHRFIIGRIGVLILAIVCAAMNIPDAKADLTLGSPFGDGMVLQRNAPIAIWGWAEPGQAVSVTIAGNTQTANTQANGSWSVTLPQMPAGGPHEMIIRGQEEIRLKDVLVGEVWICSGQSNMAMSLRNVQDAEEHIAAADYPKLRALMLPVTGSGLPKETTARPVNWTACSPDTAGGFSAVAFFFGHELVNNLDIPVGLIVVTTGATPIELWIPREGMDMTPELEKWVEHARRTDEKYREALAKYKQDLAAWEEAGKTGDAPTEPVHPYMVRNNDRRGLGTFFNGSVAPVVGYTLRGMIWYQGESNRGDSSQAYFYFHKALVNGWRQVWGQGEFPFYYVQISALDSWRPDWQIPEIWEGQTMVLQLPNTGMAVIHDLCEDLSNIHPRNKEGVGERLALWALARDYGFNDLPYSGPIYKSHEVEGNRIRIHFDYTFGGLKSRDGKPLDWFTIAGEDGRFVSAQAEVDGDTVVVWSDQVENPVAVRFAWDEKAQPNLVNEADLPAGPFRTHRPQ